MEKATSDAFWRAVFMVGDSVLSKWQANNLDPPLARCSPTQEAQGRRFGNWLRTKCRLASMQMLDEVVFRRSFLFGVSEYLADKQVEYLVIGFGFVYKQTQTKLKAVLVLRGERDHVAITPELQDLIFRCLRDGDYTEILIIHNHPAGIVREVKNFLFGDDHLPSGADRAIAYKLKAQLTELNRMHRVDANIRFFLVEGDSAREFTGASLKNVADLIRV